MTHLSQPARLTVENRFGRKRGHLRAQPPVAHLFGASAEAARVSRLGADGPCSLTRRMAVDPTEKVPDIKVTSAYPGEWYIVEVEGGDGGLSMELRRPVGDEDSDVFHFNITTASRSFEVKSTREGGEPHTHEGAHSTHFTFSSPAAVWPDFVRCIQAVASVFDTLSTTPLDREKVRETLLGKK